MNFEVCDDWPCTTDWRVHQSKYSQEHFTRRTSGGLQVQPGSICPQVSRAIRYLWRKKWPWHVGTSAKTASH